jgi:4-alpha-glucanotransferase
MTTRFSLDRRSAGLLLHPTSLPGPHGSGDAGRQARLFVDRLAGLRSACLTAPPPLVGWRP